MTDAPVAADFHEAFDVQGYFTAKVALHLDVMFDILAQLVDLLFGEILYAGIGIDAIRR